MPAVLAQVSERAPSTTPAARRWVQVLGDAPPGLAQAGETLPKGLVLPEQSSEFIWLHCLHRTAGRRRTEGRNTDFTWSWGRLQVRPGKCYHIVTMVMSRICYLYVVDCYDKIPTFHCARERSAPPVEIRTRDQALIVLLRQPTTNRQSEILANLSRDLGGA